MSLKEKYAQFINMAPQMGAKNVVQKEEGGKLFVTATVASQADKDKIINQINSLAGGIPSDLVLDLKVGGTYVVKSGDTLSKIAQEFYGDANRYMDIFNANKDKLSDPDLIKPGQELVIP